MIEIISKNEYYRKFYEVLNEKVFQTKNFLFYFILGIIIISGISYLPYTIKVFIFIMYVAFVIYHSDLEAYLLVITLFGYNFGFSIFVIKSAFEESQLIYYSLAAVFLLVIIHLNYRERSNNIIQLLKDQDLFNRIGIVGKAIITEFELIAHNDQFSKLLKEENLRNLSIAKLLGTNDVQSYLFNQKDKVTEQTIYTNSGKSISVMIIIKELSVKKGIYEISITEPIKQLRSKLESTQKEYLNILEFSGVGVIIRDPSYCISKIEEMDKKNITDVKAYFSDHFNELVDLAGNLPILEANKEVMELLDIRSKKELEVLTHNSTQKDPTDFLNTFIDMKNGKESYEREQTLTLKNRKIDVIIKSVYPSEENPYYYTLFIDITNLKMMEKKLLEVNQNFRELFENAPIGLVHHYKNTIINMNSKCKKMFDIDDDYNIIGTNLYDLIPKEEHERQDKLLEQRPKGLAPEVYESKGLRRDGTIFPVRIRSTLVNFNGKLHTLTFAEDISTEQEIEREKQQMQEQVMQSHKLESLGLLAGGIAHDFNNILMIMRSGIDVIKLDEGISEDTREMLDDLRETTINAAGLTSQLLAYTGKSKSEMKHYSCSELIENTRGLISLTVPSSITVEYNIHVDQDDVLLIDSVQFSQIVLNLVRNAVDAIDENGTIQITFDKVKSNPDLVHADQKLSINAAKDLLTYLMIDVSDSGHGITKEKLNTIFDPFYTTKSTGTGLGLSVVLGIVNQYRGFITITSKPGIGTKFNIYLPSFVGKEPKTKKSEEIELIDMDIPKQKVLIIEDEVMIAKIIEKLLRDLGHSVIKAEDGIKGLYALDNQEDITLVILDLTMPNMTGSETYREIRKKYHDLPIIVSSGHSKDNIDWINVDDNVYYLQKPYSYKMLQQELVKIFTT
ncbi:MAG: response regulator [Candidatus Heimdallarchaeota archaeon]|nr:response regulator [Candidatus Heimdallarchaeota archaeon]